MEMPARALGWDIDFTQTCPDNTYFFPRCHRCNAPKITSTSSMFQSNNRSNLFESARDSVRNAVGSLTNGISDYSQLPSEPEEEPWYQMSRVERIAAFALCLVLGILCFFLAFFFFMPMIPIFPGKFAATFTLGSILILVSMAMLRGPMEHIRYMLSMERIYFSVAYLGSMGLTLYASILARNYLLTIIFAILQIVALVWYVGSYLPGGITTLRIGTTYIGRRAASLLPI